MPPKPSRRRKSPIIPSAFATAGRAKGAAPEQAASTRSIAPLFLAALTGGLIAARPLLFLLGRMFAPMTDSAPDHGAEIAALRADIDALRQVEPAGIDPVLDGRIAGIEQAVDDLRALPAADGP